MRKTLGVACLSAVVVTACTGGADDGTGTEVVRPASVSEATSATTSATATMLAVEQRFPDVVAAEAVPVGDAWTFSVTISSPYDTSQRYADAWRVLAPDGTVLGVRELAHDHAGEQPFTRSLAGIAVPADVDRVTVEGRDLANGWGGATVEVELSRP